MHRLIGSEASVIRRQKELKLIILLDIDEF